MIANLADHLGLVHHVVRAMTIPPRLHDEAYSEGLVVLAVAGAAYDPERGVPEGAYLAQRLRWGLQSWQRREMRQHTEELTDRLAVPMTHEQAIEARRDLDQLLYLAARRLNAPEYISLLGLVYGANQSELAQILSANATQLAELRTSAREVLTRELRLL